MGLDDISAVNGFGLLWLDFLKNSFGIFVAFTVFLGIVIFVLMPAYTNIVLFGGGLKMVMNIDNFIAVVMLIMMALFLVVTYQAVGEIIAGPRIPGLDIDSSFWNAYLLDTCMYYVYGGEEPVCWLIHN